MKKTEQTALKVLVPNEAEKKRWDHLVMNSLGGNVYSLSWYLDVVAPGKWALVTNEKMDLGFPIAYKKRTAYRNIYQPFYTMFFNALGKLELTNALEVIQNEFHHLHFTTESAPALLKHRLRQRQELSLKGFSPGIYSENAQRQIKKAVQKNLQFAFHTNAREVVKIFRDNKGSELKEYQPADFKTLENLAEKALALQQGFCAHVVSEGKVVASAFFPVFRNRIIFLKGGVTEEGKKSGAMYFLLHNMLEWSKDRYEIFDFGGSNNKNVGDFYRKLGGKNIDYFEVEIDQRNLLHKIAGKLRK